MRGDPAQKAIAFLESSTGLPKMLLAPRSPQCTHPQEACVTTEKFNAEFLCWASPYILRSVSPRQSGVHLPGRVIMPPTSHIHTTAHPQNFHAPSNPI